jgi:CelD/BcsL family acetyltransferase involved in cellulose biosynthesis
MQTVDSQIPAVVGPTTSSPPYLPAFLETPGALGFAAPLDLSAVGAEPSASAVSSAARESLPALSPPLRVRRVAPAPKSKGTAATETFAKPDELAALAGVWNSLSGAVPFRSFEWMESWWRHYRLPGWQTYLLRVENADGQIVGIAPWYIARSPIAGRVIQFLGSGEACSEYLTVLTRPGHERAVVAALTQWLTTEGAQDWDLLHLTAMLESDPATSALAEDFARRGHLIHQRKGMPCWQCDLPATWEEFVRQLSKSRRERVRQLTRKYFDTARVQTRWVTTAAELDQAFPMFIDMHQRRRQSLGQPGCYTSTRFAAFHQEVSRRLCAEGKLRLLWTELDGRPVGAEYGFIDGQTVYYYSTGVEPDATADHPGWLAMIGSLRRAIDEGCRSFDFLRGDEAYKCSWGAKPCPTIETRIIARRGLAGVRHSAWLARQQLRQWAKRAKGWSGWRKTKDAGTIEMSNNRRSPVPGSQP